MWTAGPGGVELAAFALIGLLGGAHCLGMCGPLVTVYADRMREREADGGSDADDAARTAGDTPGSQSPGRRQLRQHALFNLGRTAGYTAVGGLAGALGALAYDAAAFAAAATALRAVAGVVVGALVVGVGVRYLLGGTGGLGLDPGALPGAGGLFARLQAALVDRVDAWVGGPRIAGLGAVHAALPCPILYPAYLYAFARGSPVTGALALGVVGLGTFPTLFAYGTLFGSVSPASRARVHRALGAAFVLLGLLPLLHGLGLAGVPVPHLDVPIYQPL